MLIPAMAMIALFIVVVGFFQMFGEYIYDCNIAESEVEFLLFRKIKVWTVPFTEIASVEPATWREFFSLANPPFGFVSHPLGKYTLIKRNKGIFKNVLITPNNQSEFLGKIRSKISNLKR